MVGWRERQAALSLSLSLSFFLKLTDATVAVSDSRPPMRELTPETLAYEERGRVGSGRAERKRAARPEVGNDSRGRSAANLSPCLSPILSYLQRGDQRGRGARAQAHHLGGGEVACERVR